VNILNVVRTANLLGQIWKILLLILLLVFVAQIVNSTQGKGKRGLMIIFLIQNEERHLV